MALDPFCRYTAPMIPITLSINQKNPMPPKIKEVKNVACLYKLNLWANHIKDPKIGTSIS